jgi:hypothetical protein
MYRLVVLLRVVYGQSYWPVVLGLLLSVQACKSESIPVFPADADPTQPDAKQLSCDEREDLVISQCLDEGIPCLNFESTTRTWVPITDTPLVQPIIGLQGSPMFVLAVQGKGIDPGSDSDTPDVSVIVSQGETQVGAYQARPTIIEVPGSPGEMLAPQLYVVAFEAEDMLGQTVDVIGEVEDRQDRQWCAEGSFEIGALIDSPPVH